VVNQWGKTLETSEVGVAAGISVELMAVEPVLSVLFVPEQKVSSADDSSGGTAVWFYTMLLFQIIYRCGQTRNPSILVPLISRTPQKFY